LKMTFYRTMRIFFEKSENPRFSRQKKLLL
jgi:hypothetical protein